MGAPATLPADFFDKQQAAPPSSSAPDVLPANFFDDPINAQPKRAEDLPTQAEFDASHQAAVAAQTSSARPAPTPKPSLWDEAKTAVEAAPVIGEALYHKASELMNAPLVPEGMAPAIGGAAIAALSGAPQLAGPIAADQGPMGAIARSTGEFARGMTSPENIGLAAFTGPLGKITPLLSRGIGAVFSAQLLKNAYDQYPDIRDAVNRGDWTKAAGAITTAVLSGGLGALAGVHAVAGGGEVPGEPPRPQPTAAEKAVQSARAGVEVLSPGASPDVLPTDFFNQQQEAPASTRGGGAAPEAAPAQGAAPETLPADFFDRAQAATPGAGVESQQRPAVPGTFTGQRTTGNEIPEGAGGQYGAGFGIYDVPMENVTGREDISGMPDKMADAQRYAEMIRGGSPPPPLFGALADDGTVSVQGARRLEALRATGAKTVPVALMNDWQEPGAPAEPSDAARQPSTPPAYGRAVNVLVPGETTTYPAKFAVYDMADVQPSHNPFSFQPNDAYAYTNDRDYRTSGNAARVVKQSAADTFNPDFTLTDSPTAEHGAPIVDASGNVLGGNSRTMTLARVYQRGGDSADAYRAVLEDRAPQFGVDPAELARFKKPVLVREVGGGIDAQRAITDFNKAAAAELTPTERAVSDGRRLSPETVQDIAGRLQDLGENGTLAEALRGSDGSAVLKRLVADGMITEQEKGGYIDDQYNLTPDAKSRIAKALVGRLFETPAEYRETTPAMRAKLERIAPQLLRVEGRPDWNITDTARQAIALSEDARVHNQSVEDAARQRVVGQQSSYSPDAIAMARTIEANPVKAAGAFRRYANDEALSREGSQGAFFTPPTRMEAFADAFMPRRSAEAGGISPDLLSLGADKFVREDVIPAVKRVASDLVEAKDDVMRVVAPQTRGSAAEFTGLNLRQRMAQFARRFDQGEQRLRTARRFFNTRTPEQNYDFIDDVEQGLGRGKQGELEPIARMFARMLDQRRREVQALGEGALKGYYQNYFPHIFERPEDASKFVDSFFGGKRSMEGPKSFLKHRDFPTFRDALDAGLKPVSDNPVDLVIMKAREMDRYLLAHAVLRDLADNGIAKRVSGLGPDARQAEMLGGAPIRPEWSVEKREDLPPDFVSIRDPVGGGKWYAEEGAADVLNNYLSPGLRARSGAYRTLLGVNNTMNQANLGLSAFHLRAVTISSMASRMGLGVVKALEGHPLDAAWHIATSPAAPFIDYLKGSKVLHDWFKPGSEGAPVAAITDALMKGGGRARMDAFYATAAAEKMMAAFRRGNFIGGALRSPFAAIEATSKPLMNYLVPRMKLGAFADIAQHEMEKLGPGAKVVDVQRAMSQAWDHVENRLGQMTYDNRFWNRTFKDIAMLTVRSVGWNLGDALEVGSAARAVKQMATLKPPADLHGLGFVVGYTATAALMGAIMQYLHTGQGPQKLQDYFFPRREDGRRVVSAPYVKDAYQFARDPARTIENKGSPLVSTVMEAFQNRDYYDRPIRNADAPLVKQMQQEAEFVGRQFLPFTVQQMVASNPKKARPLPGGNTREHQFENFLGVTPAPAALQPGYRPRRYVVR
jgi:hypothetical protein